MQQQAAAAAAAQRPAQLDPATAMLFQQMTGKVWTDIPQPAITRPAQPAAGDAAVTCKDLTISVTFDVVDDPQSNSRAVQGMLKIKNTARAAAAVDRATVRLCGRDPGQSLPVRAQCPLGPGSDLGPAPVAAGAEVSCTWRAQLPEAPEVGSVLADWSGLARCARTWHAVLGWHNQLCWWL